MNLLGLQAQIWVQISAFIQAIKLTPIQCTLRTTWVTEDHALQHELLPRLSQQTICET